MKMGHMASNSLWRSDFIFELRIFLNVHQRLLSGMYVTMSIYTCRPSKFSFIFPINMCRATHSLRVKLSGDGTTIGKRMQGVFIHSLGWSRNRFISWWNTPHCNFARAWIIWGPLFGLKGYRSGGERTHKWNWNSGSTLQGTRIVWNTVFSVCIFNITLTQFLLPWATNRVK